MSLGKIYKSSARARERQDHSSAGRLVGGNGFVEGWGRGAYVAEPVSGEHCSFVPHAIKPRRFYERGEPDDEVIYLPAGRGMKGRRE